VSELVRAVIAAKKLDVTEQRLANLRAEGRGPAWVKLGRSVRYDLAELERYVAANTVEPTGSKGKG
jgi:hypothetical protein